MSITDKKVVTIEFTVKNADTNEVIESSVGGEPLIYLHGFNNLVPGLEKALTGKKVGDKYEVNVTAEEGYGVRDDALVQEVPMAAFEGVEKVDVGMEFTADGPNGPVVVEVTKIENDMVTIDSNHPLAGIPLAFSGEIQEIRDASDDELEHGHIHGPSCNH